MILTIALPNWIKTDQDSIADCKKCILLSDRSQERIILANVDQKSIIWEWKSNQSDIKKEHQVWFKNYSDFKPVLNNKYLLISSTAGGIALIRMSDKKAVYYTYAGESPHSIELLPDGNIVSASSKGNYILLFRTDSVDFPNTPIQKITLMDAHNVVWDKKNKILWSAGANMGYTFTYNFDKHNPKLAPADTVLFPEGGIHDLIPDYEGAFFWLSATQNIYKLDPFFKSFRKVEGTGYENIKSVSSGPVGFPTIIMKPKEKWWTDEVIDLKGNQIFQLDNLKSYKARWFIN